MNFMSSYLKNRPLKVLRSIDNMDGFEVWRRLTMEPDTGDAFAPGQPAGCVLSGSELTLQFLLGCGLVSFAPQVH